MTESRISETYQRYVVDPGLERANVLRLLSARFRPKAVPYPGCSAHLTPSFFFRSVVYVDKGTFSEDFFRDSYAILRFVARHRTYKAVSQVHFLHQDFADPLPLQDKSFDLLISLCAGRIAVTCKRYLKAGGLFLSNNHHMDADEAVREGGYRLVGIVRELSKHATLAADDLDQYLVKKAASPARKPYMEKVPLKIAHKREADYYLFERVS